MKFPQEMGNMNIFFGFVGLLFCPVLLPVYQILELPPASSGIEELKHFIVFLPVDNYRVWRWVYPFGEEVNNEWFEERNMKEGVNLEGFWELKLEDLWVYLLNGP